MIEALEQLRGLGVAQVAKIAADAPLQAWRIRPVVQHIWVMVAFQHQHLAVLIGLMDMFGQRPQIG